VPVDVPAVIQEDALERIADGLHFPSHDGKYFRNYLKQKCAKFSQQANRGQRRPGTEEHR
jgi:hypothetical protein